MLFYVPRLHHQRMSQRPTVYQNAPWAFLLFRWQLHLLFVPCRYAPHLLSTIESSIYLDSIEKRMVL